MGREKKGAINVDFLVGFIIFVTAVAIVFGFIYLILNVVNISSTVDDLACQKSIEERMTVNSKYVDIGTKIFPLKCETKQICVSLSSGGSCEDVFGKADKNNLVLRHTVPGSTAHREEVLKFLTEEMVNIHKMAGQGKGNFMPRSTFSENYCTIFDWFALDDDLKGKVDVSYGELYEYMDNYMVADDLSALEFVYPGWESPETAKVLFENMKKTDDRFNNVNYEDWKIDLEHNNGNVIIVQMQTKGRLTSYLAAAGVAGAILAGTGFAIFTGGASLSAIPAAIGIAAAGTAGAAALGGVTYIVTTPDENSYYVAPMIYPNDIETLRNLKCTDFSVAP